VVGPFPRPYASGSYVYRAALFNYTIHSIILTMKTSILYRKINYMKMFHGIIGIQTFKHAYLMIICAGYNLTIVILAQESSSSEPRSSEYTKAISSWLHENIENESFNKQCFAILLSGRSLTGQQVLTDLADHILLQDSISHKFISIPFLQQKDTIISSLLELQRMVYLKQ
jgi:hypothetical protein